MSTTSLTKKVTAGSEAAITDAARYLTFTLNGEAYALNIFNVTEILEYRQLTVVPMMPDFIRGVINLRGRAVPVIDLAIRFARGVTAAGRRTSIIIVHINDPIAETAGTGSAGVETPDGGQGGQDGQSGQGGQSGQSGQSGQDIGILVDAVNKVEAFAQEDIEPPPAFGAGIRSDYINGMARRESDFIIVLDIDHVLSLSDVVALAAAGSLPAEAAASSSDDPPENPESTPESPVEP